jgi:SOS response regulatory protein OraA/RecX
MSNAQLMEAIQEHVAAGKSKDEITRELSALGWSAEDITMAFATLHIQE